MPRAGLAFGLSYPGNDLHKVEHHDHEAQSYVHHHERAHSLFRRFDRTAIEFYEEDQAHVDQKS